MNESTDKAVDLGIILSLLEEIERLESELTKGIETMESGNQKRIDSARAAVMMGPVFDERRWCQRSVQEQKDIIERLAVVRDGLLAQQGIEHARRSSDKLDGERISQYLIIWLAVCGFVFAATLLSLVR